MLKEIQFAKEAESFEAAPKNPWKHAGERKVWAFI